MNIISSTKQSNLFLHFLRTLKRLSRSPGTLHCRVCHDSVYIWTMTVVYVLPHVRVSVRYAHITYITRITRVTLETIHDALLASSLEL